MRNAGKHTGIPLQLGEVSSERVIAYNAGMAATSIKEPAAGAAGAAGVRSLYDEDPWSWAQEQVAAMRRRDLGAVDWDNVIEEIGDVAGRDERTWVSHCRNVISHLLKIHNSPNSPDLNHWRDEIEDWRQEMHEVLDDSPGMRSKLAELLPKAWRRGRAVAVRKLARHGSPDNVAHQRRLQRAWESRLPAERPYHLEDITSYDPFDRDAKPDPDVWPAPVAQILNDALGTIYPVRHRAPERDVGRSR